MVASPEQAHRLVTALTGVRTALGDLRLPLELTGADLARREGARLTDHLDDYLLPRVRQAGAPLLAVVGGSTGAGKSTLVNSLVGTPVTPAGVLRPTTRSPVLVHHPTDAAWFASDRILPGLPRVTGAEAHGHALRLVGDPGIPRGLAVLDAPDIDSVVEANRRLGEELLGAADLWVFVTTAARYADAVPWDLLAAAARRRAAVTVVLNRIEPGAHQAVVADLARMLDERGLLSAHLAAVDEQTLADGLLPPTAVADLDRWLREIAGDAEAREEVLRRTVSGPVAEVVAALPGPAPPADHQAAHASHLGQTATGTYARAHAQVHEATSDGTMLRGEVLARWQEFVGTGELLRALETRVSSWRDRATAFMRGRPTPEPVAQAIGSGVVDLVVDVAEEAAEQVHAAWRADPAGTRLLDDPSLSRASSDLRDRASAEVRAWQGAVLELVSSEGADRRVTARALSFGVNGLGAALMVAIFASTGGLTAAEVGVAGGAAVLAQRLLEAVFGDDAVRRLTRTAHEDLDTRVARLLADEAARFTTRIEALDLERASLTGPSGGPLREAAHELAQASRAAGLGAD
uniref:dynamin family protein n=1 Tax=Actinotalea sp. C106 TaxID=2908644 RepID=UPI00202950C6